MLQFRSIFAFNFNIDNMGANLYKDAVWCLNCGLSCFIKDGFTQDGRQKVTCKLCGTKTRTYCRKLGEIMLDEKKLLPFLLKDNKELTSGELYSLGFILADGNVNEKGILQINILEKDVSILKIIKRELEIPNEIKYYTRSDTEQKVVLLRWQYKFAYNYFLMKGLTANKTGNETWLDYMNSSDFIRGFFDGDGCFFINKLKHKYELSFTGGSKLFLEILNNTLKNQYGVSASKVATQRNKTGEAYRITLYKKALLILCEYLYKDSEGLRLERKYEKYLEIKNS